MNTEHPQVALESPAGTILCDEGLADFLPALWARGYSTAYSCEGDRLRRWQRDLFKSTAYVMLYGRQYDLLDELKEAFPEFRSARLQENITDESCGFISIPKVHRHEFMMEVESPRLRTVLRWPHRFTPAFTAWLQQENNS